MNKKKEIISPIEFDDSLRKKSVCFSVPGRPRGKERPRMARFGNHVTTYTPKNTVEYEELVRRSYRSNNEVKLENSISAEIQAVFPIPKSISKKLKNEMLNGNIPCTKKPDCDNIGKVILDALNTIAYDDDSQIQRMYVEKIYGENPKVNVRLSELNSNDKNVLNFDN